MARVECANADNTLAIGDTQLAYNGPIDQLRFGDFNGDGVTDVFTLKQDCTLHLPLFVH